MLLAIPFPSIDPILVSFGPFVVRWYALAYIAGLVIGWRLLRRRAAASQEDINEEHIDDLLVWTTLGVIIGGRVGYILFYNFSYYAAHPSEILAVWRGGMAFHGGLLGVAVAGWIFCRRRGLKPMVVGDLMACAAPVGLFFGRIANFINGELFGRVTDVPWAVVFPRGGPEPRHASQIYEAILEGAVLFIILNLMWRSENIRNRPGVLTGVFIAGYAVARGIVEMFRQPDAYLGFLALGGTMGQWLSLPMFLIGAGFIVWGWRRG